MGQEGALAPPQRVGGHLLAHRCDEAGGGARLPRPLLPGGVRRPGRRLLLLAGARRMHELLGLGRHQHGLRRADRHGAAADPPARQRGAETALPRSRPEGREDRLPGDHRAGRRLRRRRHPHDRDPRRRRIRDQRLQDLHHQWAPRRLHRPRRQDRPRGAPRRDHPLRRRSARRERREGPRLHRLGRAGEDGHARLRHRRARLRRRSRPGRRRARRGGQGLLPHRLGAAGRATGRRRRLPRRRRADDREGPRLRQRARSLRPPDRQVPGDPPQVRRDGDQDRGGEAVHLRHRLALRQRRVPGARDHDGEALRLADCLRGRRRVRADPRRLRLHEGVRDRATR
jgi:hypothetical protein